MTLMVKGKVWVWPGVGGHASGQASWHFVYVDGVNKKRVDKYGKKYGAGFVKVLAKIGKTEWPTALFPHKKENCYLISIKKSVRQKEEILAGDNVIIKVKLI